jgi:hypothetical protein
MKTTKERLEELAVENLHKHLLDCLSILEQHESSGKVWQVDIQRIDARLLVCRKHIELLGKGYTSSSK